MNTQAFTLHTEGLDSVITLKQIEAGEREDKHYLGRAEGMNLMHCVYLGARHGKDFLARARYYSLVENEDDALRKLRQEQPGSIGVEFWGDKKEHT